MDILYGFNLEFDFFNSFVFKVSSNYLFCYKNRQIYNLSRILDDAYDVNAFYYKLIVFTAKKYYRFICVDGDSKSDMVITVLFIYKQIKLPFRKLFCNIQDSIYIPASL